MGNTKTTHINGAHAQVTPVLAMDVSKYRILRNDIDVRIAHIRRVGHHVQCAHNAPLNLVTSMENEPSSCTMNTGAGGCLYMVLVLVLV